MKKWNICKLAVILILSIQNNAFAQSVELIKITHLPYYPSASTLELYKDQLYVIGDDAPAMLVLDKNHQFVDSVFIFKAAEKRIGRDIKADLEASVLLLKNNRAYLIALSSFSTRERNKIVVFELGKNSKSILSSGFFNETIKELNFEGAALINDQLLLSNRANNTNQTNQLLITGIDLVKGIRQHPVRVIPFHLPPAKQVIGISGLYYLKAKDILLFTASSEDTPDAHTDGPIGESYLGYIKGVSKKLGGAEIRPDVFLSLSKTITKNPQKIESIVAEETDSNECIIHLASDNDNGESTLFKMKLTLID